MDEKILTEQERFEALWKRLKLTGDVSKAWRRIVDAYTEHFRRYHNWYHIAWCLKQFDRVKKLKLLDDPDAVEFAIYFHDIVYQPGEPDNEERSVDVAMKFLEGAPIALKTMVKLLILDTKHKFEPVTEDGKYMVDIDISSMGDPEQNARYVANVREEFTQFVSVKDYDRGRRAFISEFLQKNRIYYTDFFQSKYGEAAKRNLEKQLEA